MKNTSSRGFHYRGRSARRAWVAMAFLAALSSGPLLAAWPSVITVFDDPNFPIDTIGVATRDGKHWFVAENWDDTVGVQTGKVFAKRHIPGIGLTGRSPIGGSPATGDRLTTLDKHALPSLAIDINTKLNLSMQVDQAGWGPTIENTLVNPVTRTLFTDPPLLIDDDSARTQDRGRSWIAVNNAMSTVWSCWTYHDPVNQDDVYCRGRATGSPTWNESVLALATGPGTEDHPSVALQPSTSRRVVAYHSNDGIIVRLFDSANAEDLPNDVALGTSQVDFPHLVEHDGNLHLVAVHKTDNEIKYATCSSACNRHASWATETIDDIAVPGDEIKHPQIAVDAEGRVFVAFQHTPSGMGAANERVLVTAKCGTGGWDNNGGELIDDSSGREQLGGHLVFKGLPAFVWDSGNDRLSVVFVQAGTGDRIARWARKDASLAYNDICAGQ